MKINPLVSVIVTTYNRKELLKETLDSILNQTYKNFELIVVDNYSDYDYLYHIKSFNDDRIRPFQNANNGIIAVNRNFGIKQAKGEYIAFCDDDDLWLPQKLYTQIFLIEDSGHGMVYTMQKQFGAVNIFSNYFGIGPLPFKQNTSTAALLNVNCIPNSSVVIKKSILDTTGYLDESKSFVAFEDNDLWIRVSKIIDINFIPEVLVLHRVHKFNIYNRKTDFKRQEELRKKYFLPNKKRLQMQILKANKIYFLLRNIFNIIFEITFFRVYRKYPVR